MSDVVTIAGSPTHPSRSAAVLGYLRRWLEQDGLSVDSIRVRDLDASELLHANFSGATIKGALVKVNAARAIIIATPVYKAAYTGVLKAFLDLLPQDGLAGKVVLPIATGGSPAHLLAIDYALKPVISALGAQHVLSGIYIQDSQLQLSEGELRSFDSQVEERLQSARRTLSEAINRSAIARAQANGHHSISAEILQPAR